jgi:regulator of replication initiation timing
VIENKLCTQTPPLRTPNRTTPTPGALYIRPPIVCPIIKICKLGHGKLLTKIEQDFTEVINVTILIEAILSDQTPNDTTEINELRAEIADLAIKNNELRAENIELRQRQPRGMSPQGTSSQGVRTQPQERKPKTKEDDRRWNLIQDERKK